MEAIILLIALMVVEIGTLVSLVFKIKQKGLPEKKKTRRLNKKGSRRGFLIKIMESLADEGF